MRRAFSVLTAVLAALCGGISCGGSGSSAPAVATAPRDAQRDQSDRTVYDGPFNGAGRLVITATYTGDSGSCCSTVLHVWVLDRADAIRQSESETIADRYEYDYLVTRIDPSTVVLCRTDSHGFEAGCFKLFIDPVARRVVKRIAFDLRQDVAFTDDTDAARLLGVSARGLDMLRRRMVFQTTPENAELPPPFVAHPLPQSTYHDFANARPARVQDNYREGTTTIDEKIAAWQAEDGGFWFARTFYDGEGTSGVGGVGFLSRSGQYSWLTIPAVFDWSVDAMSVAPDVLWAGLVSHGEGPDRSGGLLRYDRQTQRSEIQDVPGVILRIAPVGDAVFLGTTRGLYVLRNETMTWHHMEPDVTGRLVVLTERMAK